MRRKKTVVLAVLALMLSLGFSARGDAGATGTWKGWTSGRFDVAARIVDTGGRLTGSLTICPYGTCSTSRLTGTRSGARVSLKADFGDPVTIVATLSGDTLSGTLTIGGSPEVTGYVTLKRNN